MTTDEVKVRKRATRFTPRIGEAILAAVADGVPLREVCRRPGMPTWRAIHAVRERDPDFEVRYGRARAMGLDAIAADILQLVDAPVQKTPDGKTDMGAVQHRRLQVDARLKLLSCWDPKRYGNRLEIDGAGQPMTMVVLTGVSRGDESQSATLPMPLAALTNGEDDG
jgi:hypothetical protein